MENEEAEEEEEEGRDEKLEHIRSKINGLSWTSSFYLILLQLALLCRFICRSPRGSSLSAYKSEFNLLYKPRLKTLPFISGYGSIYTISCCWWCTTPNPGIRPPSALPLDHSTLNRLLRQRRRQNQINCRCCYCFLPPSLPRHPVHPPHAPGRASFRRERGLRGREGGRPLADLLSPPVFGSLQALMLSSELDEVGEENGVTLAAYLRQPGGRPFLELLDVDGNHLRPLADALAENCAPNLNSLHIVRGDCSHLRIIYQAGALAHLRELTFYGIMLDPEAILTWMEAVFDSEHKGAALKILKFKRGQEEDEQDGLECALALLDGVRRGAYPNLKHFDPHTMLEEKK